MSVTFGTKSNENYCPIYKQGLHDLLTSCHLSDDQSKNPDNPNIPMEFQFQGKGFHICNLDIRHLKSKLNDVNLILSSTNRVDILGFCETFLNKNIDDSILNIHGYQFERKDRGQCNIITPDNGRGVLIYIANHLNYVHRNDLESQNVESIWLEIRLKNSNSFLVFQCIDPIRQSGVDRKLFEATRQIVDCI